MTRWAISGLRVVAYVVLFEPSLLSLQNNLKLKRCKNTGVCIGVMVEDSLVLNSFTLCPCLYLSLKDISESRGSPHSTSRVPRLIPHRHYPDTVHSVPPPLPSSRLTPSPCQCSPRWPLSFLPDLSSSSSPLSLEVLGTKLPSALLKAMFCAGQSLRFGINHYLLSSTGC